MNLAKSFGLSERTAFERFFVWVLLCRAPVRARNAKGRLSGKAVAVWGASVTVSAISPRNSRVLRMANTHWVPLRLWVKPAA